MEGLTPVPLAMALEAPRIQFHFARSEVERALVRGVAYVALDPPPSMEVHPAEAELRVDSWGTWMRRATLEKFAHDFLAYGRAVDAHHDHGPIGNVVESYLTREGDPDDPPNAWVVTSRVCDASTLGEIVRGELTGFSIEFFSELRVRNRPVDGRAARTGEIVAPIPLFLSMVERPAINQPFASVDREAGDEAEAAARSQRAAHGDELASLRTKVDQLAAERAARVTEMETTRASLATPAVAG